MEFGNLYALITLALGLGIVHALDADHIMAVSALTSSLRHPADNVRFCLRWAIGHGLTLISIGCAVYVLGMAIPDQLSHYAEYMVGLLLIVIGFYILFTLRQKKVHVHFHRHDGLPSHAHWHTHAPSKLHHATHSNHKQMPHRHNHSAVMVGILHGAAGSAPLLVLIPIGQLANPLYGIIYLTMFSLAVLICMVLFGGVLGLFCQWVTLRGNPLIKLLRISIASGAIVTGGLLLAGV